MKNRNTPDARYSIRLEWCGRATQQWVARFCDDWLGCDATRSGAEEIARLHERDRLLESCMRHSTAPAIDKQAVIQLQSPRGLLLELETHQIPANVVEFLRQHTQEGDTRAAVAMAQLTGLTVTIKRTTQTTVRAEDLDK